MSKWLSILSAIIDLSSRQQGLAFYLGLHLFTVNMIIESNSMWVRALL